MSDCKHEPWMQPAHPKLGIEERPWTVSGMLSPPAYVCKLCGLVYVERRHMEAFQRSAERAASGEATTVGDVLAAELRKGKGPKA